MKKIILVLLFKLVLFALIPVQLYANIGQLKESIGKVTVLRNNATINASKNFKILKKDIIKTGQNSKAKVIFKDKTIITIGKNSALNIEDYFYDEGNPSKSKTQFNVFKGAFKSITGRIGKINPSKFKLKTKSANIGIRGTTIIGNQETVACTSGTISVMSNGIALLVQAGEITNVRLNIAPTKPRALTKSELSKLEESSGTTGETKKELKEKEKKSKDKEDKESEDKESTTEEESEDTTPSNNVDATSSVQDDTTKDNVSGTIDEKIAEPSTRNYESETMTGKQLGSLINTDGSKTTNKHNFKGSGDSSFTINSGTFALGQNSLTNSYFNKQGTSSSLVNTHTTSNQEKPAMSSLSDGKYIVTWDSYDQDGQYHGVYAQIFNNNGTKSGDEFNVNTYTTHSQDNPDITTLGNGKFIISWDSFEQDGDEKGVYAQIFNSDGTKSGDEFLVNTTTSGSQYNSSIAKLSDDKFVVVMNDYIQVFNNDGTKSGSQISHSSCCYSNITVLSNGNFAISSVWTNGKNNDAVVSIYDNTGTIISSKIVANTDITSSKTDSFVSSIGGDKFIVSWEHSGQDGDDKGIFAQIFNNDGTKSGDEFQINSSITNNQEDSTITAFGTDRFIVSYSNDGKISAQIFNTDGIKLGNEFEVNSASGTPHIIALSDEKFIVSWSGSGTGDSSGIYSQIFEIKDEQVIASGELTYKGFDIPALNAFNNTHSNIGTMGFSRTINGETYNGTYDIEADNTAEFIVGHTDTTWSVDGEDHSFKDMFYNGIAVKTENIDNNKIYVYQGFKDLAVNKDTNGFISSSAYNSNFENNHFYLNMKNKSMTAINHSNYDSQGAKVFNAMKMDASGAITGVSYSKNDTSRQVDSIKNLAGNIYGTNAQGLGATYTNTTYDNYGQSTQTINNTQEGIQASYLLKKNTIEQSLSNYITTGYVTQYLSDTGTVSSYDGLSISIDKDSSSITGSLQNTVQGTNLSLNGTTSLLDAYYVNDDNFGVLIDAGSITVDGTSYSTINQKGWFIAVPDSIDENEQPLSITDNESSWGYWTASTTNGSTTKEVDYKSTWVSGTKTAQSKVQDMIDSSTNTQHTFTGHTMGTVQTKSTQALDSIKLDKNNVTILNFDFGGGNGNFDGSMKFNTVSGESWNSNIGSSGASSAGFSSTAISGTGNGETINSGSVTGSYYGTDTVKSVGGTFEMDTTSKKAFGVFKADK